MDKLQELFIKNRKWKDTHPFSPGSENPYPGRIYGTFVPYFLKHNNLFVSYQLPWKPNGVSFILPHIEIYNSLYHSVFDCDNYESCVYLLKSWVKNYYEEKIYEGFDEDFEKYKYMFNEDEIDPEYDIKIRIGVLSK